MPNDLAALLVDEGAASAEAVARALDRQREEGGALDTALLEEDVLSEAELVRWLARAAELPAAPDSAWDGADARARRVFPSRVAERHGLAPFALDGKELSLVATFPVDLALLDEISFMLSLNLTAHVGPEWRVRELIQRLYGSPLAPRLAALAAAASAGAGEAVEPAPDLAPEPEPAAPEARPPVPPPAGFSRDDGEPLEPLAAALQQALEDADPSLFGDAGPLAHGAGAAAPDVEDEPPEEERPPQDRTAPPRWSLEDAKAALAAARHRDDVVLAAIRYARDFFEYAAVFAVTRDAIAGHDAIGDHDERDRARAVAIWAADPGIFKTVVETRAPHLGPISRDAAGNEAILSGLGRETPRTVMLYPVLLRDRPICVVYADNGEAPVSARRLGDLLLFLSGVGAAFERIIRERKRGRKPRVAASEPPAPPPVAEAERESPEPELAAAAPPAETPGEDVAPVQEEPAVAEAAPVPADPEVEIPEDLPPFDFGPPAGGEPQAAAPPASSFDDVEEAFFSGGRSAPATATAAPTTATATAAPTPTATPTSTPTTAAPPPARDAPAPTPDAPNLAALADKALDADAAVAAAACTALADRRRDPQIRTANEKLRRALLSGISARATKAARAIAAIRDAEAIPLLIQVLETSEPETAKASADALGAITLQRLGPDPRKWLNWWKENRGRGRAEWLFSGLTSPERETRVAAAVELSLAAPPPVAYSADLPAAEREKAARSWAGWWARSGHVL